MSVPHLGGCFGPRVLRPLTLLPIDPAPCPLSLPACPQIAQRHLLSYFTPKTGAYEDKAAGALKENLGWAIGNKQVEAEGNARKEKGNAELEAARAEQRAIGEKDKLKGNIKETAGNVLGNEQWQAEGKADRLKGEARKETNI